MLTHTISSVQQIGVGTTDFRKSWNWYIDAFGFDIKILEDDTVAQRMLPYTGNEPQKRHACIAVNLQGGGGLEIWQYSQRIPKPIDFEIRIGDLGIFAAMIKSRHTRDFYNNIAPRWGKHTELATDPKGTDCFYIIDPEGNTFLITQRKDIYIDDGKLTGGIAGAQIGVSDMDRSIKFYQKILGYDIIIYDKSGVFDDWAQLPGGKESYRRVLMTKSNRPQGPFSGLLGTNSIELVQALDRTPRKIYEGRFWGDPGFIQICYDVQNMDALKRFCEQNGHPFTVDSCPDGEQFDMGDASGRFTYIEDPDGTLIEFVETQKVPVAAKLGLYINAKNHQKPLPKILFRIMGLVSRQK